MMSDSDLSADSTVHYTVKELLDEQTALLREIDRKVDQKADKADFVALSGQLSNLQRDHGHRLDQLEEHRLQVDEQRTFRRRAWAVAGSVAGVAAIIGGSLIAALVH